MTKSIKAGSEFYIMNNAKLTEQAFAEIILQNGGRAYRVGGCVRDALRGEKPKDIDFCVVGMVKKNFKVLFPEAKECAKNFPVFRMNIDGNKCEVAFARTERKDGNGYKGFRVSAKPKVTIEEDLYRRDTTINSMAMDCLTGDIIDPYGGAQDIKEGVLRATSEHFADDPIRALRVAGQAARFNFKVDSKTIALAQSVAKDLEAEPRARILNELTKVLNEAKEPARFFLVLKETDLLASTFIELAGLSQVDFESAMSKLNFLAKDTSNSKVRFAILGLVLTKEELNLWNERMTLPGDWLDAANKAYEITSLLKVVNAENVVTAINSLRRGALNIEEFDTIAKANNMNTIALGPLKEVISAIKYDGSQGEVKGKAIGEWLKNKYIETIAKLI